MSGGATFWLGAVFGACSAAAFGASWAVSYTRALRDANEGLRLDLTANRNRLQRLEHKQIVRRNP